jgi:hypothetical protein
VFGPSPGLEFSMEYTKGHLLTSRLPYKAVLSLTIKTLEIYGQKPILWKSIPKESARYKPLKSFIIFDILSKASLPILKVFNLKS